MLNDDLMKPKQRPHHYVFGHIVLREMFFDNPGACFKTLATNGTEVAKSIWDNVGKYINEGADKAEHLPSDGLECSVHDIGSGACAVIVSLPKPQDPTEAHFVGLVLRPRRKKLFGLLGTDEEVARYITLEKGVNFSGEQERTTLCEWRMDAHLNMGDGPKATVPAFAKKIAEMMKP